MTPVAHTSKDRRSTVQPRRAARFGTIAIAAVLFASLAGWMWMQQRAVLDSALVNDQMDGAGHARPLAVVSRAVRAMKLVTVELETTVTAESSSPSWRGDVSAVVRAPVRLFFGTDLSEFKEDAVQVDPFGKAFIVSVPRPMRLSTEVIGEGETSQVQTGWLRLRSIAGEYHLGLARKGLYEAARRMTIKPEDARLIEDATREQIGTLVRAIAGEKTDVLVVFRDVAAVGDASGSRGAEGIRP